MNKVPGALLPILIRARLITPVSRTEDEEIQNFFLRKSLLKVQHNPLKAISVRKERKKKRSRDFWPNDIRPTDIWPTKAVENVLVGHMTGS